LGYYTIYKLDASAEPEELISYLESDESWEYGEPGLIEIFSSDSHSIMWYDFKRDMLKLSNKFPNILFTLTGKAEKSGDLWVMYFKGGRSQRSNAIIKFEPFDEECLE
jgi:hypothetical protein